MGSVAPPPRLGVFGYGSLVDRASAAVTLGRAVEAVRPMTLPGWQRRFSTARDNVTSEKTFARAGDGMVPPTVLALNLESSPDGAEAPNGALIEVDEAELARLDGRELRYDRVDVTAYVNGQGVGFDGVFAYVARAQHLAVEPPEGAVVLASYVAAVETAFATLGEDQVATYHYTTGGPPVELMDGVLMEGEVRRGNPTRW